MYNCVGLCLFTNKIHESKHLITLCIEIERKISIPPGEVSEVPFSPLLCTPGMNFTEMVIFQYLLKKNKTENNT